ncbi:hypothetical protein EHYA_06911 [Embleya hyalina]|uniref:Uncharacterized protein n=2 Tax=Embleya hyalina TaxID=516124 RepID=A0A401YX67_9ACTN|nr:hypothetical protein EHYA_06911 [Embleya hyalina]
MTAGTGDDEDDEFDVGMKMALGGLIGALFDGGEAVRERHSTEPSAPVETDPTTGETRDP